MKKLLALIPFLFCLQISAQSNIVLQNVIGSVGDDQLYAIAPLSNGYIAAGYSTSDTDPLPGNYGDRDFWLIRLNSDLDLQWSTNFGGIGEDWAYSVLANEDQSAYLIAGTSTNTGPDVEEHFGERDLLLIGVNELGNKNWSLVLGTQGDDRFGGAVRMDNGDYLITGSVAVDSLEQTELFNRGKRDIYLARVSAQGELLWQKGFGSSENDDGRAVYAMGDNRYLLAAGIGAGDGEIESHNQATDTWLAIVDDNGELLHQATFGGNKKDSPTAITQLSGGDYVLCGESFSDTGITNYHGGGDYWLMRFDSDLNLVWERAYGGSSFDSAWDVSAGEDNTCVVGGLTQSINGDIMGTFPSLNAWLVSLDSDGEITGSRSFGGGQYDGCHALTRSPSGNIISAGYTDSFDGDLEKHGSHWAWLLLLSDDVLGLFSVNEWSDISAHELSESNLKEQGNNDLAISWNDEADRLEIQPLDSKTYSLKVFNLGGQLVYQMESSGPTTAHYDFHKGQYYLLTGQYRGQLISPIRFYVD